MNYDLAIFDLDGTLVDTIDDLTDSANYAMRKMGYPEHSREDVRGFVGNGITKLVERALPYDSRNNKIIEEALQWFREYYNIHCEDKSIAYPGIHELLLKLQMCSVKMSVASNKYQFATYKIIKGLFPDVEFAAIHGNRDGVERKPNPTIVYNIINEIYGRERKVGDVIYIGDSVTDIETARNAGLKCCAVTWGFKSKKVLMNSNPDYIVDKPEDILSIICNLLD